MCQEHARVFSSGHRWKTKGGQVHLDTQNTWIVSVTLHHTTVRGVANWLGQTALLHTVRIFVVHPIPSLTHKRLNKNNVTMG